MLSDDIRPNSPRTYEPNPTQYASAIQTYRYHSPEPFTQSTMDLLDLPVDLIHKVLLYAVISRGVTRALRLKLVCSMSKSIKPEPC